jgi:predicted dehydrogenase
MNIFSATAGFGADVPDQYFYLEDPSNFANLVTIQGAHTLDLAFILAGEFAGFNSLASRQYPSIRVGREGSVVSRQTYDHLLVQGVTSGGAVVSIEVAGGRPAETPFRLELVGEKARINLQGGSPRGFQSGGLELRLDDKPVHVDYGELALLPEAASNVGGIYATFRDDILNSTSKVAGFGYAVRFTKVIDAILNASGRKLTGLSRAGE